MRENNICFGVDYYPEHWLRDRWDTDARLMKEAGFDVVRMAEFSWAKLEPEFNCFCFEWLDDAIALLATHGIKTILGTPTAAPPAWIIENAPDILPVNREGTRLGFGGRHHVCHSNAKYREHTARIVKAMAEHYKNNDAVIGWQIDNELGNSHEELCMCDNCKSKFHEWLEKKYGTIESFNESCGTVFWSQTYSDFHQIPIPRITPNSHNPSLLLSWKRFCSDLLVEFQQLQLDIIRNICPDNFVTHNFMGFFDKLDYFDLARNLDFVSHDNYPSGFDLEECIAPSEIAASLDLMRGLRDKPFWVMEQQSGATGWETISSMPRPGQLRLWTAQAVAHGADAIIYFRWRTCCYGTEQYWHGILPHSGIPGRRYHEIKKTISELRPVMEEIRDVKSRANVAMLFSYEQNWAFEIQPHHPELDYIQQINKYYSYFYDRNIPVDFISAETDFSEYELIVAPLQFLTKSELVLNIKKYLAKGGHIILTMRTGVKNDNNVCVSEAQLPCKFGDLLGIEILDYDCLRKSSVNVSIDGKIVGAAGKWCDIINLNSAEALAYYCGEYYNDVPAVTANTFGNGCAYYIGFEPDSKLMNGVMDLITAKLRVEPISETPKDVELVCRPLANGNYYFILNHSCEEVRFLPNLKWEAVLGADMLEPYGIAVYRDRIDWQDGGDVN